MFSSLFGLGNSDTPGGLFNKDERQDLHTVYAEMANQNLQRLAAISLQRHKDHLKDIDPIKLRSVTNGRLYRMRQVKRKL